MTYMQMTKAILLFLTDARTCQAGGAASVTLLSKSDRLMDEFPDLVFLEDGDIATMVPGASSSMAKLWWSLIPLTWTTQESVASGFQATTSCPTPCGTVARTRISAGTTGARVWR